MYGTIIFDKHVYGTMLQGMLRVSLYSYPLKINLGKSSGGKAPLRL